MEKLLGKDTKLLHFNEVKLQVRDAVSSWPWLTLICLFVAVSLADQVCAAVSSHSALCAERVRPFRGSCRNTHPALHIVIALGPVALLLPPVLRNSPFPNGGHQQAPLPPLFQILCFKLPSFVETSVALWHLIRFPPPVLWHLKD